MKKKLLKEISSEIEEKKIKEYLRKEGKVILSLEERKRQANEPTIFSPPKQPLKWIKTNLAIRGSILEAATVFGRWSRWESRKKEVRAHPWGTPSGSNGTLLNFRVYQLSNEPNIT